LKLEKELQQHQPASVASAAAVLVGSAANKLLPSSKSYARCSCRPLWIINAIKDSSFSGCCSCLDGVCRGYCHKKGAIFLFTFVVHEGLSFFGVITIVQRPKQMLT
jgi:hypothetical protein